MGENNGGTGTRGDCLIGLAVDHWSWVASGHLALTHSASERDTNTHLDKGHWTGEREDGGAGGGK